MAWPYLVMKQNVIYVLIIIKNLHNSKCSHGAGCTLFICDGQYIIIFEYRLLIIISKQLSMRFLANARNDRVLCGIREAVAIRSANRHCLPITLHQLMLSFRTNPPSGGEVRNLQLRETVSNISKIQTESNSQR